jgi:hypothetical protein
LAFASRRASTGKASTSPPGAALRELQIRVADYRRPASALIVPGSNPFRRANTREQGSFVAT